MTTNEDEFRPVGPPPKRWRLFLPPALLGLLALALFGFWFWMSRSAGTALDAWIAREASLGRVWTCADRSTGGFPFRLEIVCKGASFVREGGDAVVVRGTLDRILVVTQVYQPDLVLVEFDGPLRLEGRDKSDVLTVAWDSLRASLRGRPGAPVRMSFEGKKLVLNLAGARGTIGDSVMESVEVHMRRNPERFETERAYDISAKAAGIVSAVLDQVTGSSGAASFETAMVLTRAEPFAGQGFAVEAERWRNEGGKLTVSTLQFAKGDRRIQASGDLGLDASRRVEGRLDVALTGFAELVKALSPNPQIGMLLGIRPGAQNAPVKLPLRADRGMLSLGPIVLFPLPPLY